MNLAIIFLVSFLITAICTPVVIIIAKKLGLVDNPETRPHPAHVHSRTIPRAGGLAIYLGIVLASLLFLPLQKYLVGIIAGATVLLILGLIDDKLTQLSPYIRLALLFLAAAFAVGAGIGISYVTNPFLPLGFLPPNWHDSVIRLDQIVIPLEFWGSHKIILIADIFAFLWIITLTQVINWSKGVDGQMPGITFIAALTLGILSLRMSGSGDLTQFSIAKLSFIVAGTSLGFLIFNWYPAKILPGFSGSTILAFMLATVSILSGAKIATAALVLGIPIIDFIYTFWRRILSGHSPVWGDRGHLHHKLLDLGFSHQQISLFYILGSGMLGAVALLADTEGKVFASLGVAIIFLAFILWLNSFGGLSKRQDPDNG